MRVEAIGVVGLALAVVAGFNRPSSPAPALAVASSNPTPRFESELDFSIGRNSGHSCEYWDMPDGSRMRAIRHSSFRGNKMPDLGESTGFSVEAKFLGDRVGTDCYEIIWSVSQGGNTTGGSVTVSYSGKPVSVDLPGGGTITVQPPNVAPPAD